MSINKILNKVPLYFEIFFGLPFLRSEKVKDRFIECLSNQMINKYENFADYILNNNIESEADFLPNIWSDFKRSTTINTHVCESSYARFNSKFNSIKTNLYQFIEN